MKIVILGGDGFCGWATSLYLSARGHEIIIVDNLSRRDIDNELGVSSLTPIAFPQDRILAWKEVSNNEIKFHNIDVAREYDSLLAVLKKYEPDAVVHFAEQRAAPYSMRTSKAKRYTVDNNTNATHNLLCATVESKLDIHLVHLGTMGVYGYGKFENTPIPEGYLKVQVPQPNGPALEREVMYPADPGSVYHMTKTLDALLFYFYNKNDKLRVTDLHQGIVWGTATEETARDERLVNRFDYDGDYGTVLNRFLMQAAIGYPLTVHGTGGQKRAFIHIRDSARCIDLALQHPPQRGERVQIFNQMTETHRVGELAEMVSNATGVPIQNLENPRNEAEHNELNVTNENFLRIGLEPIKLSEGLAAEVTEIARKYAHRVDRSKILATSRWR